MTVSSLMTPIHPKWDDFINKMSGPRGCNFRETPEFTFDCDNSYNRPIARRLLWTMGLSPEEIEQSLGYLAAFGGYCDCEIVFNVKNSFDSHMGRSRKNPKRRST